MLELWQMHLLFMVVFFGFPAGLAYNEYRKWKKRGNKSLVKKIKKDLEMDF